MSKRAFSDTLVFQACFSLMTDWLYSEAGNLTLPDPDLWLKVKTEALWPPVTAFITNTKRIHAFWKLSPHLIEQASSHILAICNAVFAVTGRPVMMPEEYKDEQLHARIKAKMAEQFLEKFNATGDAVKSSGYDFTRALDNFSLLISQDPEMENALYAALCAQITSAWTAWEVLATDLWESVINYHPATLANLKGKRDRISRRTGSKYLDEDEGGPEFEPRLIEFERITKGTFNAGKVMGTLLKKEFKFQTLSGIRRAYSRAFSTRSEDIDRTLSDISLDRLNLVRNLIIHKSGNVDQIFTDGARDLPGWSVNLEMGKPLQITGDVVRELLNRVFKSGEDLIKSVYNWVASKEGLQKIT